MSGRSAHIEREHIDVPVLFWPAGIRQLGIVWLPIPGNTRGESMVYGIDSDRRHAVFRWELQESQREILIAALENAYEATHGAAKAAPAAAKDPGADTTIVTPLNAAINPAADDGPTDPVVVIPNTGPNDPGPKAAMKVAVDLHGQLAPSDAPPSE